MNEERSVFAIQSYGRTATQWISRVLNSHPDIFCSHGPDLNPLADDDGLRFVRIHRELDRFSTVSIDDYFDALMSMTGKKAIGNIHGGIALKVFKNRSITRRNFKLLGITRNPISRIESLRNRWIKEIYTRGAEFSKRMYRSVFEKNIHEYTKFIGRLNIDDPEVWLFCNAVGACLVGDKRELESGLRIFRYEDIAKDNSVILQVVGLILDDPSIDGASFVDKVWACGRIDQTSADIPPEVRFAEWDSWQKDLFLELVSGSDMDKVYKSFGYEMPTSLSQG